MANEKHLAILKQGVRIWNEWRSKNNEVEPNLQGADLRAIHPTGAKSYWPIFSKADFHRANLVNANFEGADLSEANFMDAQLQGADLAGAYLYGALFYGANLSGANLEGANLQRARLGANLNSARLSRANLMDADLFRCQLVRADFRYASAEGANFRLADLSEADMSYANLIFANLVETNLQGADLTGCKIYGISAWKMQLDGAIQSDLIISRYDDPTITVDNLEIAQFIYLLLNNEKVRDVINTISTKVVLILGRFTHKRMVVLDAIWEELRKQNYVPVLFVFERPASRDTQETVTTLARLARFVVADITNPKSIPQELVPIVESLPSLPVQPLLKYGSKPWGMYDHIRRYPWVLPIVRYKGLDDLIAVLQSKVITSAEEKAKEMQKR
jgi:uncharacterized protein YjbI with pentapeptide repeats